MKIHFSSSKCFFHIYFDVVCKYKGISLYYTLKIVINRLLASDRFISTTESKLISEVYQSFCCDFTFRPFVLFISFSDPS